MTRTAVVVIAALNEPVYRHYIANYWTDLIRHTNDHVPDVDVYLLIESGTDRAPFAGLDDNVIEDPVAEFDDIVEPRFRYPGVPSILHKTVHAFEVLDGRYDMFFRTNLSSMIKLDAFRSLVETRADLTYAGAWVWTDALRADLEHWNRVGPDRPVRDMADLDEYPGNTFISGSGFLIGMDQARHLVQERSQLQYGLPDDVAIGLMLPDHQHLPGFSALVEPTEPLDDMVEKLRATPAAHIRLQRFPLDVAQRLWERLADEPWWR